MNHKLRASKNTIAYWFISPWIIGFVLFFLQPIVQLVQLSFSQFRLSEIGMSLLPLQNPWEHYIYALKGDSYFPVVLTSAVTYLLTVPVTVFFSLLCGLILSKSFRGRTTMRVIFFLPLIISAGVISSIVMQNSNEVAMGESGGGMSLFNTTALMNMLLESGFPQQIVDILSVLMANVADLVWKSTVQTFIFLVALLAIPRSHYEVAHIEGASAWEAFWKVTFPVSLPFVLVNSIYTIIDVFSSYNNGVMRYITTAANKNLRYDYAAAMSWIYFLIIIVILGLIFLFFKPFLKKIQ